MRTNVFLSPSRATEVDGLANGVMSQPGNHRTQYIVALALAILSTATSLGIATYAGWERGGLFLERAMNITLGCVSVLYVHLLPMGGHMLRFPVRVCAVAMWCISVVVVLYGQVLFFMVSHQHAGDQRASTAPVMVVPPATSLPPGRSLTEIAQDIAKVRGALASANARGCAADCTTIKVRKGVLSAKLAALDTEAGEAKRREAEEDRRNERADHDEALRASLRADPVASPVASWLGTTELGLELMLAVACAVVLEGAAIIGWLLVSAASHRASVSSNRGSIKSDCTGSRETIISGREMAAPNDDVVEPGQAVTAGESAENIATSEEDLLLQMIHEAVVARQLKPTQKSIRKFLGCGQSKAGNLNRLYLDRFGAVLG